MVFREPSTGRFYRAFTRLPDTAQSPSFGTRELGGQTGNGEPYLFADRRGKIDRLLRRGAHSSTAIRVSVHTSRRTLASTQLARCLVRRHKGTTPRLSFVNELRVIVADAGHGRQSDSLARRAARRGGSGNRHRWEVVVALVPMVGRRRLGSIRQPEQAGRMRLVVHLTQYP